MNCELVQELLSAYLDDELSEEQKLQVESHLAECTQCAHELNMMRQIDESIREEPVEEPSREFVFTMNRRIQDRIKVRPGFRWFKIVPFLIPVAVTALILVIIKNIEPGSDFVNVGHRVAYAEIKPEPDLDVTMPKLSVKKEAEYRHVSKGVAGDKLKKEAPPPAPAVAPAERKTVAGQATSTEVVGRGEDYRYDGFLADDEVTIPEIPEGRIVRAIVDTNGRILKVVTGRNIIPEPDTFLENRLQGQQLIVPTVSGEKQQLYVDLTIQEDTCK